MSRSICFLDEPTLGLDILIAKEIRELIHSLAKEQGKRHPSDDSLYQ